jgi:hypothetical protein
MLRRPPLPEKTLGMAPVLYSSLMLNDARTKKSGWISRFFESCGKPNASQDSDNVELRSLVSDPTLDYCRVNFRFALLEHRSSRTPDEVVIAREAFWKRILVTRGERGLNRN